MDLSIINPFIYSYDLVYIDRNEKFQNNIHNPLLYNRIIGMNVSKLRKIKSNREKFHLEVYFLQFLHLILLNQSLSITRILKIHYFESFLESRNEKWLDVFFHIPKTSIYRIRTRVHSERKQEWEEYHFPTNPEGKRRIVFDIWKGRTNELILVPTKTFVRHP